MKANVRLPSKAASNQLRQLEQLKSQGEFSKAIGLADLMIGERAYDHLVHLEVMCLKSECQLRMALFAEALATAMNALREARELEAEEWIGRALFRIAAVYAGLQIFDLSIKHAEEAAEIHRKCGHKRFYVSSLVGLSAIRIHLEDFTQARKDATAAARMATQLSAFDDLIKAKIYIAECCIRQGDLRAALKHAKDADETAIALRDRFLLAKASYILGKCSIRLKEYDDAERYFVLSAERFKALHDKGSLRSSLEWLARVFEARGEFKQSTALYKSVIALERELVVEHRQSIRIQVSQDDQPFSSRLLLKSPNLTTTEIKLCELLLKFFSNKEIAKLLGISVLTVERHRFNIRKKLGLENGASLTTSLLNT
jgi:tetratricopeptide (TPR) repeat protein